jgi:hypothetical protein
MSNVLLPFVFGVSAVTLAVFFAREWATMRKTVDIPGQAAAPGLTLFQRAQLLVLGLKTPVFGTVATFFSFVATENDQLKGFQWEQFISHDKAVLLSTFFWLVSLWSHFSGLKQVAAMPPVNPPKA